MSPRAPSQTEQFKAFLSYSHAADGKLAPALQSALHWFAKPLFALRAMRVFRDQTNLSVNPQLWPSIQEALNHSEFFVLLASPTAATSQWVRREVEHWLTERSSATLLLVLTEGEIVWDEAGKDFDWEKSTAIPRAIAKRYSEEPLYLDLRWAKNDTHLSHRHPAFQDAVATLAAKLHGRSKDELLGEDVRQRRRTRSLTAAAVALIIAFACVAGWQAVRANQQRTGAVARELATRVRMGTVESPVVNLLLAIESLRRRPTPDGQAALISAISSFPKQLDLPSAVGNPGNATQIDTGSVKIVTVAHWPTYDVTDSFWIARDGSGREVLRLPRNGQGIGDWSENGKFFAVSDDDGLQVWNVSRGKTTLVMRDDIGPSALAFSPNDRYLATGSQNGVVEIRDLHSGGAKVGPSLFHAGDWARVNKLAFSSDGRILASASNDPSAMVWEVPTGRHIARLEHGDGDVSRRVEDVYFEDDDGYLVTSDSKGEVRVWQLPTGKDVARLPRGQSGVLFDQEFWNNIGRVLRARSIEGFFVSPDGRFFVSRYPTSIHNTVTGEYVTTLDAEGELSNAVFSTNSQYVATVTATSDKGPAAVQAWETQTGDLAISTSLLGASSLAITPDGKYLAAVSYASPGGDVSSLSVWNREGKLWSATSFRKSLDLAADLVLAPVSAKTVGVWEIGSGLLLWQLSHSGPVEWVRASPDGQWAATVGSDSVWIWSLAQRSRVAAVPHKREITDVEFDPHAQLIGIASADGVVRVVRVADGQVVATLKHDRAVQMLIFGPDGRFLAVLTPEQSITTWDIYNNAVYTKWTAADSVRALAFGPDGRTVSAMVRYNARFEWPAQTLIDEACQRLPRNLTRAEWKTYLPDDRYRSTCPHLPADTLVARR